MRHIIMAIGLIVGTPIAVSAVQSVVPKTTTIAAAGAATAPSAAPVMPGHHPSGPVDQSAPLDFTTQPASVPHAYVPGRLYNAQVLNKLGYAGVITQMAAYSAALGVSCQYCHNLQNLAYDTPTKKIARSMILMTENVESSYISGVHRDYPKFAVSGAVGCITCHRGVPAPAVVNNVVPVSYLDWPAKSTRQEGYVVNAMYAAASSLGVNCIFCHNSADFRTLQSIPTNRIAHRMWQMVDDINHKWTPASTAAVTCYTCHHGNKWPTEMVHSALDESQISSVPAHPEVHLNPAAYISSGR